MEKLYYTLPMLREIDCKVVSVENNTVTTDRTIFYPEGGGQAGDRGFLGKNRVLDTKKAENGDSLLIMESTVGIKAGDTLKLELDWTFRLRAMVTHTAQHMLSGLLYTMSGIGTVAVHMSQDYFTIETDREKIDAQTVSALVERANEEILNARKVTGTQMSHSEAEALGLRRSIKVEGPVRIVEIDGVDRIACGGVHVPDTSMIRLIVFTGHEQIRGHERLFFTCGDAAVAQAVSDRENIRSLCSALSCTPQELTDKTSTLLCESAQQKARIAELSKSLAYFRLKDRLDKDSVAAFIADGDEDISVYGHCAQDFEDLGLCIVQDKGDRSIWLIALKGKHAKDFNIFRKELLAQFDAKGGGKDPLFQGVSRKAGQDFLDRFLQVLKG